MRLTRLPGAATLALLLAGAAHCVSPRASKIVLKLPPSTDLDEFAGRIATTHPEAVISKTWKHELFTGVEVQSNSPGGLLTLAEMPEVDNACDVNQIVSTQADVTVEEAAEDARARGMYPHRMTGVNRVHGEGVRGEGVTVAVVDDGVAWRHPALGGCLGSNCKVIGGYDFTGDGNGEGPDEDPFPPPITYADHGTHVAGIIVGESDMFTGVAPKAKLLAYKVFGSDGFYYQEDTVLIDAFLKARDDGADVISASLREIKHEGFSTGCWSQVATQLVREGIVVVIAAGNDGASGPFHATDGASGREVISVASVETEQVVAGALPVVFADGDDERTVNVSFVPGYANPVYEPDGLFGQTIVFAGDACGALDADEVGRSGENILLVAMGGCELSTKVSNVESLPGFITPTVLLYLEEGPMSEDFIYWLSSDLYLAFYGQVHAIEHRAGEAIVAALNAGISVSTAEMPSWAPSASDYSYEMGYLDEQVAFVGFDNPNRGNASTFTSLGPLYDLQIKPDIAAPGGNILSTVFVVDREGDVDSLTYTYGLMSGTSMAAPYVAGVAALYISKHGGREEQGPGFAQKLVDRIISSGRTTGWFAPPLEFDDGRDQGRLDLPAPVFQVGNGIVDAHKVVSYDTQLSFEKFALNDTKHFRARHEVTIENLGDGEVEYTFSLEPATGFETANPSRVLDADELVWSGEYNYTDIRLFPQLVGMEITPEVEGLGARVTVAPGESETVEFVFERPTGVNESMKPLYSGKILVHGSNGEELSVPYLGAAWDMKEEMVSMFLPTWPRLGRDNYGDQVKPDDAPDVQFHWSDRSAELLSVYYRLGFGATQLRWDVFTDDYDEADWAYPPSGVGSYVGAATDSSRDTNGFWQLACFPLAAVAGNTADGYRMDGIAEWNATWTGQVCDGGWVRSGRYKLRFAALLPFGDPAQSEDWDVWMQTVDVTRIGDAPDPGDLADDNGEDAGAVLWEDRIVWLAVLFFSVQLVWISL